MRHSICFCAFFCLLNSAVAAAVIVCLLVAWVRFIVSVLFFFIPLFCILVTVFSFVQMNCVYQAHCKVENEIHRMCCFFAMNCWWFFLSSLAHFGWHTLAVLFIILRVFRFAFFPCKYRKSIIIFTYRRTVAAVIVFLFFASLLRQLCFVPGTKIHSNTPYTRINFIPFVRDLWTISWTLCPNFRGMHSQEKKNRITLSIRFSVK